MAIGDLYYVYSPEDDIKSQLALSAFSKALQAKELLGVARFCRTAATKAPSLIALFPYETPAGQHILQYARLPYAEDYRRYEFPSLTKVVSVTGKLLTEHSMLPTEQQQAAMDDFVDAADLDAGRE